MSDYERTTTQNPDGSTTVREREVGGAAPVADAGGGIGIGVILAIILLVLLLGGGGYYLMGGRHAANPVAAAGKTVSGTVSAAGHTVSGSANVQ